MHTINNPNVRISKHAEVRLQQRGFTQEDVHLIRTHGEPVDDGYMVTDKMIRYVEDGMRRTLQRLQQLRGAAVIEQEGVIVTAYRTNKSTFRRLRGRGRGWGRTKRSRG